MFFRDRFTKAALLCSIIALSACGGGGGGGGTTGAGSGGGGGSTTPADRFVISGNSDGTLSLMLVDAVAGFARAIAYADISSFAVSDMRYDAANSRLVAVTSNELHTISVSGATGELLASDSGVTSGNSSHMELSADGVTAYVASGSTNGFIDIYEFNTDGTFGAPTNFSVSVDPDYLTMNPAGDKLYLVSRSDNQIQVFDVNVDGSLGSNPGTMSPGQNPTALIFNSAGTVAYVTRSDNNGSTLQVHDIDAASSLLAPSATEFFDVGSNPIDMVIDSSGANLYVLDNNGSDVHHYGIDTSTGGLTFVATTSLDFSSPTDLTLSDTGAQLYVGHSSDDLVATLDVDATSGSLTEVEYARVFEGSNSVVAIGGAGALQPTATFLLSSDPSGLSRFSVDAAGLLNLADKDTATASLFGGQVDINYYDGLLFGAGEDDARNDVISSFVFDPVTGTTTVADSFTYTGSTTADLDGIAVGRSGRVIYVLDEDEELTNGGHILTYSYNDTTGAISRTTSDNDNTGQGPESMSLHPAGQYLYSINSFGDTITRFRVSESNGTLSNIGTTTPGSSGAGNGRPIDMKFHPNGRIAYVSLEDDRQVRTFTVNANGSLSNTGTVSVPQSGGSDYQPNVIGVHPSGRFVYVGERDFSTANQDNVALYSVDSNSFTLNFQSRTPVAGDPTWIEMDPQGQFLMVRERDNPQSVIEVFTINQTTGALTNTGQAPDAGGTGSSLYPTMTLVTPLQPQ